MRRIELALFHAAYADHHLQDAFANGHSGFARINSPPNASQIFHNYWNKVGRQVRGRHITFSNSDVVSEPNSASVDEENWLVWRAYGDGQLDRRGNIENQNRMLLLNQKSIENFLTSFADERSDEGAFLISQAFPVYGEIAKLDWNVLTEHLREPNPKCEETLYDGSSFDRDCWQSLDDPFLEPVFPLAVVGTSVRSGFGTDAAVLPMISFEYSFYRLVPLITPRIRVSFGATPVPVDETVYLEAGLTYDFGAFRGQPFSQKLALGYAGWEEDRDFSDVWSHQAI